MPFKFKLSRRLAISRGGRSSTPGTEQQCFGTLAKIARGTLLLVALTLGPLTFQACELISDPVSADGLTLAWAAPVTNADGTPLTDLAGYRLYYGPSSPLTPDNSATIDLGDVTSHTLTDLEPGTYYFAVAAVDVHGNVSELSQAVSAEVGP